MKILHVVTLITPDGAYGGPARVATSQVHALGSNGHSVTLVAAADGFGGSLPDRFDGAPVKLFPANRSLPGGFASTFSLPMLRWLRRSVRSFDIVHLHLARDLTMLPAAAIVKHAKVPYVLQTHGMISPDKRAAVRLADKFTTRSTLRRALAIASLSDHEDTELRAVAGQDVTIQRLQNGIDPQQQVPRDPGRIFGGLVDVLYLARLHERKRPELFLRAALAVVEEVDGVRFSIAGPDGGEMQRLQQILRGATPSAQARIRIEGAIPPEQVLARMAASDVYVLPTVDEFFGLTAIEAMLQGLPVIVDRTCGLASMIESARAGIVFDGSVESLIGSIRVLLDNEPLRVAMGARGSRLVHREYSIESVARSLEEIYMSSNSEVRLPDD